MVDGGYGATVRGISTVTNNRQSLFTSALITKNTNDRKSRSSPTIANRRQSLFTKTLITIRNQQPAAVSHGTVVNGGMTGGDW
jgi:hypothetical protein